MKKPEIANGRINKIMLIANIIIAGIYFSWWLIPANQGNPILYSLLFFGEIYHVFMALTFWFTLWPTKKFPKTTFYSKKYQPSVNIFITVAGEPVDIIRKTVIAAKNIKYEDSSIYLLNDGYVSQKNNWNDIVDLAREQNIYCITRRSPGGAKAGNINSALRLTRGEVIVILDADMIPSPDFLEKVLPFFEDKRVGFVQTPQFYKNFGVNTIAAGAWEQQEIFFGPIMTGKEKTNSAFICGTNFAIRRKALESIGGMCEKSIAEDFITSIKVHQKGWISHYLNEVLCQGLAPEDLGAYYKQQLRWARGSLEVLFGGNYIFKKGLTLSQKIQYLSSALYYFSGVVVAIDMIMPLIFLSTGIQPVSATTTSFALFFIPFMFVNLYSLYLASGQRITFRSIAFATSSWPLQLIAFIYSLLGIKIKFAVTPKQAREKSFVHIAFPHILYILVGITVSYMGIIRDGLTSSVMTNIVWVLFNVIMFLPFIQTSFNIKLNPNERLIKNINLLPSHE